MFKSNQNLHFLRQKGIPAENFNLTQKIPNKHFYTIDDLITPFFIPQQFLIFHAQTSLLQKSFLNVHDKESSSTHDLSKSYHNIPLYNLEKEAFRLEKMSQAMNINQISLNRKCSDGVDSIEELEQEYEFRRQFRKHKLETVKHKLQKSIHFRERKSQSLFFYFLNLSIPITLTCLNAYILLDLGVNSELKGKLITTFVFAGFLISVISNLQIAPWKEVLKLYFMLDSLIPVLIAGLIGFFSVFDYLSTGEWYELAFQACYPVFVFYFAGSLRVMIAYQKWEKWKLIVYKLGVMSCGLIFFYVGFIYMKGAYKITKGYLPGIEQTVKNVIYLYVFGNTDLFFEYYRRISEFDQTDQLKYEYQLKNHIRDHQRKIIDMEINHLEEQVLEQELMDRIVVRQMTLSRSNAHLASVHKNEIKLDV